MTNAEELQRQIAALQQQLQAMESQPTAGTVIVSDDSRINGIVVGVNLGRIVYGRAPQEDERRRLVWYLDRLASRLARLSLRGLTDQFSPGKGVDLMQVYVMLATNNNEVTARGTAQMLTVYLDLRLGDDPRTWIKEPYHPDFALPHHALSTLQTIGSSDDPQHETHYILYRRLLATEAVHNNQHLFLLGDPGSGKSTFVRHLAWALAQWGLDQPSGAMQLFGWSDQDRLLPVIVPLRRLAGRLGAQGETEGVVFDALRAEMQGYNVDPVDDLLNDSFHHGKALLFFDGLDEVPLEAISGVAGRLKTLQAVAAFAQQYPRVWMVVTCRTRAFEQNLRNTLDWPVETLAPFTLGQIRHFIPAWYREMVDTGYLTVEQAARMSDSLLDTVVISPKLRAMAETPLLLTLMALVRMKGDLPRDRPQLYERILELLLGQWDEVRDGQSLSQALGLPDWGSQHVRPLLDRLSYEAHAAAKSNDGRGRLQRATLRDELIEFFKQLNVEQPWEKAGICLNYFEQRSGLLAADESQNYVFSHLTLQEHCAGRHMFRSKDAPALVLQHRADDRWREPIMLGIGVIQEYNPALIDRILSDLIDRDEAGQPKAVKRWYRDLIFAAEIGADRDWNYLRTQQVNVERLQRDLRQGLVALLNDMSQPLPVVERVRAGFLLGDLGDPRYPVTIEQWRTELERAQVGDTSEYFCHVEAGTYIIGSTDDPGADDEKPRHSVTFDSPFLIARYSITNHQWQAYVQDTGQESSFNRNHPNRPIVQATWEMCNAFCAWLSEQLEVEIRLPSEDEWEAAARGGDARCYPWGNTWQDDRAATGEDQEERGWRQSVPVGCYPAGASPWGALDMAGNVWEWTADQYLSYRSSEKYFTDDAKSTRGGGYDENRPNVRCGARSYAPVDTVGVGFRVLCVPPHNRSVGS